MTERSAVTFENAELLMAMWHNLEFGHPHKDGIRQAATILYNVAHVAAGPAGEDETCACGGSGEFHVDGCPNG